jgi:RNA polymerase sigma-70 factor (ECF subfamily)
VSEYPELDAIMDGIRARDEQAYSVAYAHTADVLASFANGMVHDRAFAEDAVQQAFLELAVASPQVKGDGRSLRAWLFRSVRFTCLDELRRRKRHPESPTDPLPDNPPDSTPESEGDPDLEAALGQLSERQRTLLTLKHVAGLSGEEIAQIVGSPRTNVYAATRRAERRLARLLAPTKAGAL